MLIKRIVYCITLYYNVCIGCRKEKMEKTISIRLDEKYEKGLEEIANLWGNVTSKSDIIRYCIWYTWKHAVKNKQKNSFEKEKSEN